MAGDNMNRPYQTTPSPESPRLRQSDPTRIEVHLIYLRTEILFILPIHSVAIITPDPGVVSNEVD
jgi:hypothetical protein